MMKIIATALTALTISTGSAFAQSGPPPYAPAPAPRAVAKAPPVPNRMDPVDVAIQCLAALGLPQQRDIADDGDFDAQQFAFAVQMQTNPHGLRSRGIRLSGAVCRGQWPLNGSYAASVAEAVAAIQACHRGFCR